MTTTGSTDTDRLYDLNHGVQPHHDSSGHDSASFTSRLEAFGSRTLRSAATTIRDLSGDSTRLIQRIATPQIDDATTQASPCSAHDSYQQPAVDPIPDFMMPRPTTPPSLSPVLKQQSGSPILNNITPKGQTGSNVEWTLDEVKTQLASYWQDVRDGHSQLTGYILESTKAVDRRVHSGVDLFANVRIQSVPEIKGTTMRVKSKQHLKAKRDQREAHYLPVRIKTNKPRVPPYRFHHVEIRKNIITPNTMLTFVPHLRDLESSEEVKYNVWLKELEDIDLKSGFKPMNREDKQMLTIQGERAAKVSLYLDTWLENLSIAGCNKSALISVMASREPDDAITPRQKTDILKSHQDRDNASPGTNKAAQMFTDAFQQVFKDSQPPSKQIDLRKVLMLDESVDNIMDSKPIAKDATSPCAQHDDEDEDELAESNLATYCILGCLICFSHSCDHGEYDNKNMKRTFSISSCSRLSDALKRRRKGAIPDDSGVLAPCQRDCYLQGPSYWSGVTSGRQWTEDERVVLRSIYTTATHSTFKGDPICLAAEFLDRSCNEVHNEFNKLNISLPEPEPPETTKTKNLSWYDRRKKVLLGDWQDHTRTHEHQRRENLEPCSHKGPCGPGTCSCVNERVLCDKFCGCTVDDCAYKFTGCACHSLGKACQQKRGEKPCICVQLNRECDPQLCGSCGVLERADPKNADNRQLQATGCQNCDLQRGVGKSLLLGQSQLDGVGYGLFTAEDIAQDEFIIEYVGELITHDEGVRREARRGDVFDEESNVSYVFTLLEDEGIWVDAAIYGNLSRYINHASEQDKRGCNITPRILYVNGEYRIKFTAMRDIAAGEELFFNYGENFPNLTKNLLDNRTGKGKSDLAKAKAKGARAGARRDERVEPVARKASKPEHKRKPGRPRVNRDLPPGFAFQTVEKDDTSDGMPPISRKRKRRVTEEVEGDDDDDEGARGEYRPSEGENGLHNSDSGIDSDDDHGPGSSTRLRRRNRLQQSETPTKRQDLPKKTRGKRGGARPGSGRPRKHPRPVAKPVMSTEDVTMDEPMDRSSPPPPPSAAWHTVSTPESKRTTRRAERPEIVEIADSDDAETDLGGPTTRSGGNRSGRRREQKQEEEDDDEDQDVLIRQRSDRSTRTRRPPAKFRDDDMWN